MHDFLYLKANDMSNKFLKERVEYLKESEGGRIKICQIMDEIKQKGKEEGIIEGMMKSIHIMITKKGFTLEEALDFFEIPIKEQSIYKQRFIS